MCVFLFLDMLSFLIPHWLNIHMCVTRLTNSSHLNLLQKVHDGCKSLLELETCSQPQWCSVASQSLSCSTGLTTKNEQNGLLRRSTYPGFGAPGFDPQPYMSTVRLGELWCF